MDKSRNYASFYLLLKKLPHADKSQLVMTYTAGRTDSLREMSDAEYRTMLRGLQSEVVSVAELRRERSSVLHLMQRYGVDTTDWAKVNSFTNNPRISGKPFARLSSEELQALAKKIRAMMSKPRRLKVRGYVTPQSNVGLA